MSQHHDRSSDFTHQQPKKGGGGNRYRNNNNRSRNRNRRGGGGGGGSRDDDRQRYQRDDRFGDDYRPRDRSGGGDRTGKHGATGRSHGAAPKKVSLGRKLLGILTFGLLNKDRKNAKQGGIGAGGKKPTGNRSGDGASAASSAGSASRENRSAMGAGPGRAGENPTSSGPTASRPAKREPQPLQPVDLDSVTTPKLHVGNLSYDAVESDLFNLFNGVGKVRNAEIVTHSKTQRSKGFGFVLMSSVEEAKRAVQELHGKSFIGGRVMTVLPARSGPPPGSQDREEGAETE